MSIPSSLIQYVPDTKTNRLNFCARLRSDIRMLERSKTMPISILERMRGESMLILESRNLIYPPIMKSLGIDYETPYKARKIRLGVDTECFDATEDERRFGKFMENTAALARKTNWKWRIGVAAEELHNAGWYPFFITLTVDPKKYDPEKIMKGTYFQQFRKKLAKVSARCLGHPPPHKTPGAKESDYIRYVGNVEHGKSRLHHHSHYLFWMRAIPNSWKQCPNAGIRNVAARNKMECRQMKRFWPYSEPYLSKFCYFRTINDIWEANGHCMPLVKGKPFEPMHPAQAGGYVTKYMMKGDKEWRHNVKSTRNLGLEKLNQTLNYMRKDRLEILSQRPETYDQFLGATRTHSVPIGLLRRLAKRMLFFRSFDAKESDTKIFLSANTSAFPKMLKSVRDGDRPERMLSPDLYDWLSRHLPEEEGFCKHCYQVEAERLGKDFPVINYGNRQSIGANDIGHSYSFQTWSRTTGQGSVQIHSTAQGSRYRPVSLGDIDPERILVTGSGERDALGSGKCDRNINDTRRDAGNPATRSICGRADCNRCFSVQPPGGLH